VYSLAGSRAERLLWRPEFSIACNGWGWGVVEIRFNYGGTLAPAFIMITDIRASSTYTTPILTSQS